MRSLELALEQYDSDKITSRYLDRYDLILQPWVKKKIVLLELGILKGGSLLLWRDYFPLGTIVGIDISLPRKFNSTGRIRVYKGNQTDLAFLSRVANEIAPNGFDIIIDDASHIGEMTKISFWHLFDNHLKPGGLYVIEDWGTGYWDDWPDGKNLDIESYFQPQSQYNFLWSKIIKKLNRKIPMKCHSYGMVGFIKQLIDEQGVGDITKKLHDKKKGRRSKFKSITIVPAIVFIQKAE